MECFICSKIKEDFAVWHNKTVIAATYDSEFQNNEHVRKMSDRSVICHDCIQAIINQVNENQK